MARSVEDLDDDEAVALYAAFRARLHEVARPPSAAYHRPFEGGNFDGRSMLFHAVAQDCLRETANLLNAFGGHIEALRAWQPLFEAGSERERYFLMIEHVRPRATLSLSAPQALRGRFIYAATAGSYHASVFLDWPDGPPKWPGEHVSMKTAKAMSKRWAAWPALAAALGDLGNEAFGEETGDFRNQHEHGHPRGIGIGHITSVRRKEVDWPSGDGASEKVKRMAWGVGTEAPLQLDKLLPLLSEQHAIALTCFEAYYALIEEQHAADMATLPSAQSSEPPALP